MSVQNSEEITPEYVAQDMLDILTTTVPEAIESFENSKASKNHDINFEEIESRIQIEIFDTKIKTYSIAMEISDTNTQFPLNNINDLKDQKNFEDLLEWINKYHPDY